MQKDIEIFEFVQSVKFEFIVFKKNSSTKDLLVFDDSREEICNSKASVDIANARRYPGLSAVHLKHNLFQQRILAETLTSRTRITFSSNLPVMWCKSLRLMHNWGSDQG